MRSPVWPVLAFALAFAASPATAAEFVAKSYEFKPNIRLEVGLDLGVSLRLDVIEFEVPDAAPGAFGASPRAKVVISNVGSESRRVGIAIAVEDGEGRLVAAGTGGTKMFPLRAERQMSYSIPFPDVHTRIGDARVFRISFEME